MEYSILSLYQIEFVETTTRTIIKIGIICVVEDTYRLPIDVEWAFMDGGDGGDDSTGKEDNNNDH